MASSGIATTVAFISGANQGIGRAIAERLLKEHGFHVIIGSRNTEAGAKVAESLVGEGHAASSVQLDLHSDTSIASAVKYVDEQFGRLDVLINNAGVLVDSTGIESTRRLFTDTFSTNVIGAACLTDACIPLLRKSSLPRVIFISSVMGSLHEATVETNPWYNLECSAYDSSKAALNMLMLNYARRLKDANGRVNAVCPGLVHTNLHVGVQGGTSPYIGAQRAVEVAVMDETVPSGTFSSKEGPAAW